MLDPRKATGNLDEAACRTIFHSDGFRINSLSDAWTQDRQMSSLTHFRATRNVEDHQLLLSILDEALEITALPAFPVSTTNQISATLEHVSQHENFSPVSQESENENQVLTSVNILDIASSVSEMATSMRERSHRNGMKVKRRRTGEKLPGMDRQ